MLASSPKPPRSCAGLLFPRIGSNGKECGHEFGGKHSRFRTRKKQSIQKAWSGMCRRNSARKTPSSMTAFPPISASERRKRPHSLKSPPYAVPKRVTARSFGSLREILARLMAVAANQGANAGRSNPFQESEMRKRRQAVIALSIDWVYRLSASAPALRIIPRPRAPLYSNHCSIYALTCIYTPVNHHVSARAHGEAHAQKEGP